MILRFVLAESGSPNARLMSTDFVKGTVSILGQCSVSFVICRGITSSNSLILQQSHQHKFECCMKAIELLLEQRNFGGLVERISQVIDALID